MAVLAFAAVAGASSASAATVLCETQEAPCSKAHTLPAHSGIAAIAATEETGITLKSTAFEYKCGGYFTVETTQEWGSPLSAIAGSNKYLGCTFFLIGSSKGTVCPTSSGMSGPAAITATGAGKGTVVFGSEKEHFTFTINCMEGSCTLGAPAVSFGWDAGGYVTATNVKLTREAQTGTIWCSNNLTLNLTMDPETNAFISTI